MSVLTDSPSTTGTSNNSLDDTSMPGTSSNDGWRAAANNTLNCTKIVRGVDLTELYSANVLAKILQVAQRGLSIAVGTILLCDIPAADRNPEGSATDVSRVCSSDRRRAREIRTQRRRVLDLWFLPW